MPDFIRFEMKNADVVLYPSIQLGYDPRALFDTLRESIEWECRSIMIYGVLRQQPRLIAWYGDHPYTYSGLQLKARPMSLLLESLKARVSKLVGSEFNGVLLNFYPDRLSSIGMHSDNEPEFGPNPTIASLSLGAERIFKMQHKDKNIPTVKIPLTDGSVLVMAGETQSYWKHGIDKTNDPVGPRINLTFRNIINSR